MDKFIESSEQIALFCRLHLNAKRSLPIRSSEMGMLIYLVKTDGEKTSHGVAKFFKVSKSMATNMVTSLLANGYIEKEQSQADKRRFILKPTEKAIQLVESTYQKYFKTIAILELKMGKENFNDLIRLLQLANTVLLEDKKNGENTDYRGIR